MNEFKVTLLPDLSSTVGDSLCVSDIIDSYWVRHDVDCMVDNNEWVVGTLGETFLLGDSDLRITTIEEQVAKEFEGMFADFAEDFPDMSDDDIDVIVSLVATAMEVIEEVGDIRDEVATDMMMSFLKDIFAEAGDLLGLSFHETLTRLDRETEDLADNIVASMSVGYGHPRTTLAGTDTSDKEAVSMPTVTLTPTSVVELEALRTLVYDASQKGDERASEWAEKLELFKSWQAKTEK